MTKCVLVAAGVCLLAASTAYGQVENPDYRIKAQFRDAGGESVGNANFRVKSRFMQVYYGGVSRKDEFRFQIELDSSAYANQAFDVYLNDAFITGVAANSSGFFDQTYRSDFKPDDAPDLPLPASFPEFVDLGDVVNVFDSLTHALVLSSTFGEEFERGDHDEDGDVDGDDLDNWRDHYGSLGLGPASGDYTGDGRNDGHDFLEWQRHVSSGPGAVPAATVPEPVAGALGAASLAGLALLRRGRGRRMEA